MKERIPDFVAIPFAVTALMWAMILTNEHCCESAAHWPVIVAVLITVAVWLVRR